MELQELKKIKKMSLSILKTKFFTEKYANPQNFNNNFNRDQDWDFTLNK